MYVNSFFFFFNDYVNCLYFDSIFKFKILHGHPPLFIYFNGYSLQLVLMMYSYTRRDVRKEEISDEFTILI